MKTFKFEPPYTSSDPKEFFDDVAEIIHYGDSRQLARNRSQPHPRRQTTSSPDTSTLDGWRKVHDAHGKGPYKDATINGYQHWICRGCGEKKVF